MRVSEQRPFQTEQTSGLKALRWDCTWHDLRSASVAEIELARGKNRQR